MFENGSSQIQAVDFDQCYSPVAHADYFKVSITIADMHRLATRILDVSNALQNINVNIHERFYVSPLPYYLHCFEISYTNVTINRYEGTFCIQCMSVIQGIKPSGRQQNKSLDIVITIIKHNKSTIDHAIYIKVFSELRVSYLMVYTDDVLDTTNNKT